MSRYSILAASDWLDPDPGTTRSQLPMLSGIAAPPPSALDAVLERAPGHAELAEILPPLLERALDLLRSRRLTDAQVVSGLYQLMFEANLPTELRSGIYQLDYLLDMASERVGAADELHEELVRFLAQNAAAPERR